MNELAATPISGLTAKTSLSSNSSSYTTPCQSPGSLGSLDSTNIDISLKSKDSIATGSNGDCQPSVDTSESNTLKDRPESCSSVSSVNSVKTLLPPSSTVDTTIWRMNLPQFGGKNGSTLVGDQDKQIGSLMLKFNELQQDWYKVIGLEQQINSIGHQMSSLRETIGTKMNDICKEINGLAMGNPLASDFKRPFDTASDVSNFPSRASKLTDCGGFKGFAFSSTSTEGLLSTRSRNENGNQLSSQSRNGALDKLISSSQMEKLPAMVKGYLVRRLLKTEKVKDIIKTIKDTTVLLENYRNEERVAKEEIDFHRRLMIQLEKSLVEFHDIFFNFTEVDQMKLISRSREIAVEKNYRSSLGMKRGSSNSVDKPKKPIHDKRKDTSVSTIQTKQRKSDPIIETPPKTLPVPKTRKLAKVVAKADDVATNVPSNGTATIRRSQRTTTTRKRSTRSQAAR